MKRRHFCHNALVALIAAGLVTLSMATTAVAQQHPGEPVDPDEPGVPGEPVDPGEDTSPEDGEEADDEDPMDGMSPQARYEAMNTEEFDVRERFFARVTPGVWAPWTVGDVTTDGETADVDRNIGDTFDDMGFGWTASAQVGVRPAALLLDYHWLGVDQEDVTTDTDFAEADSEFSHQALNASVGWLTPLDGFGEFGPHLGIRYNRVDSELETIDADDQQENFQAAEGWIDPIIGLAGRIDPEWMLYVPFYADVGGLLFGSDFTWQGKVALGLEFHDFVGVELGYRHLRTNYEGDDLDFDTMITGPTLGITGKFE